MKAISLYLVVTAIALLSITAVMHQAPNIAAKSPIAKAIQARTALLNEI